MDELDRRADALLASIGRAKPTIDYPMTLHWPTVGDAFDDGVLVVGQAVYGWMNTWTASDARDPEQRQRIIGEAKDPFPHLSDPMGWIDGHHARRSPFWTVARQVTDAFAPGDAPWFSRLTWANLCPVAPNHIKANPSGVLLEAQTNGAASFLDAAIREIRPSLVLVIGGPYVWPFITPLRMSGLKPAEKPLYRIGFREDIPWVVGMHPGGASRRGWGPNAYADLIIRTVGSLLGQVGGPDD